MLSPSLLQPQVRSTVCAQPLPALSPFLPSSPPPPTLVVFKFNLGILKLLGAAWGFETQGSPLRPMACSRHTVTGVWSRWVVGRAGRVGLVFLFVCFYPFYLTLCFFPPLFFFFLIYLPFLLSLFSFFFFLIKEQNFLLLCNLKKETKKKPEELWGGFCTFFLCKYWTFLSFIVVVNLK